MGAYLAHLDALWLGALLALPVFLGVAIVCRMGVRSPATRHALWLIALLAFIAPAGVAMTSLPSTLRGWSERIAARLPERFIPTDAPASAAFPLKDAPTIALDNTPDAHAALPASLSSPEASAQPKPKQLSAGNTASTSSCPQQQPAPTESASTPVQVASTDSAAQHPLEADEPAKTEAPTESLRERLAEETAPWIAAVREAVRGLRDVPPLPPLIWLGGFAASIVLLCLRLVRDRRVTRLSLPATAPERAALLQASSTIGLRRPPELVFVPNRVSPMVTCGVRKRLVMPRSLWRVLDPDARQAVLLHELAHLRRRDHWVHWLSLVVGALYWWHPLVWVIRARLRDEADLCCDAWVTSLRPERRRGYAETLLRTTAFLNVPGVQTHAAGLAMASPTKRKLARRITMVMTHTVRPKLSVHGSSVVAGVALLALLVMPGVACPPAEKDAPKAPEIKVLPAAPDSTFERHMRDQQGQRVGSDRDAMERVDKLRALEAEAATVRDRLSRIGRVAPDVPAAPRVSVSSGPARVAPDAPRLATTDAKISRAYHMPKGRLSALTELMVRADVPVLVSPEGSRLVVHATRNQHHTFASFARMICPEGVKITSEEGEPIADEAAERRGLFAAAPQPDGEPSRQLAIAQALEQRGVAQRAMEQGKLHAEHAHLLQQRRAFQSQHEAMMRHARSVEGNAGRLFSEAEKRFEQSERELERAESRHEKAAHYKEKGAYEKAARYAAEAEAMEAKSEALERQAEDLERQAEDIERQAEDIERQAEDIERQAEELEARAEAFEDRLEEIEDQIAEMGDAHDHDDDHDHEDHDH